MIDRTIFLAKKQVTLCNGRWYLEIFLIIEGRIYDLTHSMPIHIEESDVRVLCPGTDSDSAKEGMRFVDVVGIENAHQFCDIFRTTLTDEAEQLLNDVYSGKAWSARVMDTSGNVETIVAYTSDSFRTMMSSVLSKHAPCWIEVSCADTHIDDWVLMTENEGFVFSNIRDGMPPLSVGDALSILNSFVSSSTYSDREEFRGTVTKQGNSMVLKVTDQCRRMGLDVGSEVDVTMEKCGSDAGTDLIVFDVRRWSPIDDPDELRGLDSSDMERVKSFLKDFDVIGTVSPYMFPPAMPGNIYSHIFDHCCFLKTSTGENIVVSQPYDKKGHLLKDAREWADNNCCIVEEYRDRSWHKPGETTLFVFRKARGNNWRIPRSNSETR